jgi:TrmH family RNA methyltransferase
MMHLSSLKNPIVQKALRLRVDKTFRHSEGLCLVFKDHLIEEIAQSHPIEVLFTLDPYQNPHAKETFFVTKEILEKITGVYSNEKRAAILKIPPLSTKKGARILVFDRLQDPGNVGTLMRSMEAFGFDQAFFIEPSVDPFNEKTIRSSMGAVFRLDIKFGTVDQLLEEKLPLIGADMEGVSLEQFVPPKEFALVLGHEGQGIHPQIKNKSTMVKIPMLYPTESLNVAQAGAILLYFLGKSRGL